MHIDLGIPEARLRTESDIARVDSLDIMLEQKAHVMAEVRRHLGLNPKPHRDGVTFPDASDSFTHTQTNQRKPKIQSCLTGRNVHRTSTFDQKEPNPFSAGHVGKNVGVKKHYISRIQHIPLVEPCTGNSPKITLVHPPAQAPPKKTFSAHNRDVGTLNGCKVNKQWGRLLVPSYPLPPSVMDFRSDFLATVKSRPLRERFKRSEFIKTQRIGFFNTLLLGYKKDCVIRRQEQHKLDVWELKTISHELDMVEKTFKKFIESSNEESVALVKHQLQAENQQNNVKAMVEAYRRKLNAIKTVIFRLEGQISTLLLCRDLMLELSPSAWRTDYKHQARRYDVKREWRKWLITLYSDYSKHYPAPKNVFLDEAMELLFKYVETLGPPKIYFTDSWQIAMLLRRQELDCLRQIGDAVDLERKIAEIDKLSKDLTKYRTAEMNTIIGRMDKGQAEFEYQRKRAAELEATVHSMIPKYIDTLFSGDIILETTALIEVLYAEIFGQGRQTPDPVQMMTEIETVIRLQNEQLADIDPQIVKYFEKKIEADTKRNYKAAARASRVYREVKRFLHSAQVMHKPPPRVHRTWKIPARRSKVLSLKTKKTGASSKRESNFQHLQLNGILINEEVEDSVGKAISAFVGQPVRLSSPAEGIKDQEEPGIDIFSYASTESLEKAIYDQPDTSRSKTSSRDASEMDQKHELMVIEMGYHSDEELIKQNYDKKNGLVEKPPVQYEIKLFDDRFMVGSDVKPSEKDRIHFSREPPQAYKNNELSWR